MGISIRLMKKNHRFFLLTDDFYKNSLSVPNGTLLFFVFRGIVLLIIYKNF